MYKLLILESRNKTVYAEEFSGTIEQNTKDLMIELNKPPGYLGSKYITLRTSFVGLFKKAYDISKTYSKDNANMITSILKAN